MKTSIAAALKQYKFVALILLAGLVLMLLPSGEKNRTEMTQREGEEEFSLEETERRMESILKNIQGVGQVDVMLTLKNSAALELAKDSTASTREGETKHQSDVVTVSRGSGEEEVVVTQQRYPQYQGAVVVCEGGGSSGIRLTVIEVVSVLTGLGSDKITVVQWK